MVKSKIARFCSVFFLVIVSFFLISFSQIPIKVQADGTVGTPCRGGYACDSPNVCAPQAGGGPAMCQAPAAGSGVKSKIKKVKEFNEAETAAQTGTVSLYPHVKDSFDGIQLALAKNLCAECLGIKDDDGTGASLYGSLVAYTRDIYQNKPADTGTYVADLLQDMHVVSPAYAQGIGFVSLNPILEVWKTFRNLAYFVFVIIFVVIGFLIMFRQKIGSQAVITAEQAIPGMIVAMLLVTFSYAIAGLMIDLMYLFMYLIAGLFSKPDLLQGNVFQIAGDLIGANTAGKGAENVASFVFNTLGQGLAGALVAILSSLTMGLLILIVIVFNAFRLFIELLKTYVFLIINIAFAPLILMMTPLSGGGVFVSWVKGLIANLAVFPTILILLIIFDVLSNLSRTFGGGFSPPYLTGMSDPGVLPFLAGLALILALPEAVVEVRKKLGGEDVGIFGKLMQTGLTNIGKAADIGMPVGGAVGGGAMGAIRSGRKALKMDSMYEFDPVTGLRGRLKTVDFLKNVYYGAGYNLDGGKKKVGGIKPYGKIGYNAGSEARKTIDNIRDGRFLDPNNIYRLLLDREKK